MIVRNKSNKPIGIDGESLVIIMPDEEKIVRDEDTNTNGVRTLERMGMIELRPELKLAEPEPVADEKPVEPKPVEKPAEEKKPVEEPAEEKKPAAKKSKAKPE